jgi:outer membrane protein W
MKKILTVGIILFSMTNLVKAQTFEPFKVDIAAGAAIPSGTGSKGGVLFAVEPKYAVMDQISVGLRLEAAITARGAVASDGSSASGKVAASSSYVATGDYYFNNNTFRPFAGIGAGIYSLASADFDTNDQGGDVSGIASATKFGGLIRAGFELKHFRLGVEYNLIGSSKETVTDFQGNTLGTITTKNSYLGIKLGFFLGGARKK